MLIDREGASSWLTAIRLVNQGLVLNKQEFRDFLRLRCNMPLSDLPSKCVCGEKCIFSPCLLMQKAGEGSLTRDTIAFATYFTSFLGEVCTNVEVEPQLHWSLDNERLNLRSAVTIKFEGKTGRECRGLLVSRSYSIFRCQSTLLTPS